MTTTTDEIVFPGPGEIEGFWALDKMHAPRPVTPLSFDLVVHPLAEGFTKAQAEYDCPIMVTHEGGQPLPLRRLPPASPTRPRSSAGWSPTTSKLAAKVPTIGKTWEEEWKPAVIATQRAAEDRRLLGLERRRAGRQARRADRRDAPPVVDPRAHQLRPALEQRLLRPLRQGRAAGRTDRVVPDAAGLPHPLGRCRPAACGRSAATVQASPALRRAVRHDRAPSELPAALDASEEGRAFRRSSTSSCSSSAGATTPCSTSPTSRGGRTRRSRWRASPASSTSTTARTPSRSTASRWPAARSCSPTCARCWPTTPTTLAKLDELYEAARYSFPLTEDHAFYIDQLFIGVFRRFALAVGQRLVDKGVIDDPDDVFYLYRDELVDALTDGGDRRTTVAERRASFERASAVTRADRARHPATATRRPRPVHGRARVPAPRHRARRRRTPIRACSRRVAGSPGAYTGPARVVRSLAEALDDLEDGEVMVCEMTLPPWVPMFSLAGAVVSDVGGVLSHSADRGPRVRPARGRRHRTSARPSSRPARPITVDGTKGVVYLDGRERDQAATTQTAW